MNEDQPLLGMLHRPESNLAASGRLSLWQAQAVAVGAGRWVQHKRSAQCIRAICSRLLLTLTLLTDRTQLR